MESRIIFYAGKWLLILGLIIGTNVYVFNKAWHKAHRNCTSIALGTLVAVIDAIESIDRNSIEPAVSNLVSLAIFYAAVVTSDPKYDNHAAVDAVIDSMNNIIAERRDYPVTEMKKRLDTAIENRRQRRSKVQE